MGSKMVKCRAKPAADDSVELALETREGLGKAEDEWVGWMAFEASSGQIGGLFYKAVDMDGVDNEGLEEDYDVKTPAPQFFAAVSSDHSAKAAHVSIAKINGKSATVQCLNDEMDDSSHAKERISLLVFQGQTDQAAVVRGWLKQ